MINTLINEMLKRWNEGDRFYLLCREDSETKDVLIGSYDDCLEAAGRRYDFEDDWPGNFFLMDITDDLIEEITGELAKGGEERNLSFVD